MFVWKTYMTFYNNIRIYAIYEDKTILFFELKYPTKNLRNEIGHRNVFPILFLTLPTVYSLVS